MLSAYRHLDSSLGSVENDFITGSPDSVLLKSISKLPGEKVDQCGVMLFGSGVSFGLSDLTIARNDWENEVINCWFLYGGPLTRNISEECIVHATEQ